MRPLRALVVTNMWPTPADPTFGVFVHEQVAAVRRQGVRVDVAFVDGRAAAVHYARAVPRLRRVLGARRYDVVHAHHVLAALAAWLAGAGRQGRRWMITHHGIEVFEGWQAPVARWLTGRADRTVVIGDAMARHLGLGREAVVPCGVDLAVFRPGPRADARARLGLDPGARTVAWVGADRPEKRLALARAAVARLARADPHVALHVVSGRPHAEVAEHLRAADVLLVTSTREGGPLVVKEALACGRPVVSTDVGDVRAVVAGVPGCGVADDDPAALAAALQRALDHGPVDEAGPRAAAPYAEAVIAARIAAIYADMADRRAARGGADPLARAWGR